MRQGGHRVLLVFVAAWPGPAPLGIGVRRWCQRHSFSIPPHRELKRHLFVIEERIVESLAWEPASPLYSLIVQSSAPSGAAPAGLCAASNENQVRGSHGGL